MGNVARHTFAYRGACGKRITIVVRRRLELRMQRGSFGFPIFSTGSRQREKRHTNRSGRPHRGMVEHRMLFLKAITNAKKNVYIQTPYFLPTESLVKALQTAALAKVDVRLMIPERSDSTVLRFASFSYITEMLRAGVKVYFYQPAYFIPRRSS